LLVVSTSAQNHRSSNKPSQIPSSVETLKLVASEDVKAPSDHAVEVHHSLHVPLDQSQVYWNFGGSTVLTKNSIRLTPASQNKRGWLWNDYPIESENFELEFSVEIFSRPHFGGDGMAVWLLQSTQDPTFQTDPTHLNGDVFGMRNDFRGVGVVFDVYDNDGKRDNPSVFVIYNPDGVETNFNHDNDYANDMYKRVPAVPNARTANSDSFSCVANLRNTGRPSRVMLKSLHNVLHVYVDADDGVGYRFCLAVEFDKSFKDHHIAFTAMTGQVADVHEISQVTTRYLKSTDSVDDSIFIAADRQRANTCGTMGWLVRLVSVSTAFALLLSGVYQLYMLQQWVAAGINAVDTCQQMNALIEPHILGFFALCAWLLITLNLYGLLLQAPLLIWRGIQFPRKAYRISALQLGGDKVHGSQGLPLNVKFGLAIASYAISVLYFGYAITHC
jgi:hypothetical protein